MDETTRVHDVKVVLLRDRDVLNLLDQLELFTLKAGGGRVSQKEYWLFVYGSMKSGKLATKSMEKHIREKLKGLGIDSP